ncbi:MAG TPA: adenylate/guanylate cyclase domain-containing protein [Reyranella sp.]|jgi:adenylate cyclase|nr:adenylate/guanylate cyclase domain-containing protein [Reyranella sp.]
MDEPTLVRRLTTIASVDVVGFSTMSASNEEHALDLLGTRMATAGAIVKHHRGRVFKLTGDGLLAEFVSPVEAVRAALEIQEAMRSTNATAGPDDQLVLRIGINLGDIVESGDDLMGDAVNVAVRLESIAPHGGICVSAAIYDQIVGKLTLGAEDMGEQHVKNIPRPIHAYRLTSEGKTPVLVATSKSRAAKRSSRLVIGAVAVVAIVAIAGVWLLREKSEPAATPVQAAQAPTASPALAAAVPQAPATTPPPAAAPPAPTPSPVATPPPATVTPRVYSAGDVPFVPDVRRRALENYGRAEDSKAMAINVRGIFAVATRRIDAQTARRIALEECNKAVQREVPVIRESDRCTTYAVGNDVVWTFRSPPLPPPPYVPAARPSPPITLDPATVPLVGETARKNLGEHYLKSDRKRALVLGPNHFDWWSPSDSEADAVKRNLQICGHLTGRPCVIYAIDEQVVVRTPQRYRVVDIFTPQALTNLDASQQDAVERYLVANDWRAIAVGRNGRLGIVVGRASESAAADNAIQACAQAGGTECAVSAVGPFLVTPK